MMQVLKIARISILLIVLFGCSKNEIIVSDLIEDTPEEVSPEGNDPNSGVENYLLASSQNREARAGQTLTVTAPAVVHFDATGYDSTEDTEFVRLRHRFDFGDTGISGQGSWDYPVSMNASERLKNEWIGLGVTAHMYEEAGSYMVQHKVRDINGQEALSTTLTIIVQDPEEVFENNTICLYRGSSIGEGTLPSGSVGLDVEDGWPIWESNTRYLLRSGEDFSRLGDLSLGGGVHNIQIGKYESGEDPIVATIYTGYGSPNSASETDWPSAVTIYDINAGRLTHRNITNSHSFIRGQIRNSSYIGAAIRWWLENGSFETAEAYTHNKFTAYVDTYILTNSEDQISTVFGTGYAPIFLGTRIGSPTRGRLEHTVRMFGSYKGVYQYAQFDPPHTDGRVNIRIQSNGRTPFDPDTFTGTEWSQYNSLEKCDFVGALSGTPFGAWIAPESDDFPEIVMDTGVFNNVFSGWSVGTEIALGGENLGYGGNTFNRTPLILMNFKINGGIPDGPYFTDLELEDPTPF